LAVETRLRRFWVLTIPAKLAVETKPIKFCVLTRPDKFAVDTRPETEEIYPTVPRPTTVEVKLSAVTPAAAALIVTEPVPPPGEIEILDPATILVTPAFKIVTIPVPVGGRTVIAVPAWTRVTATLDNPATVETNPAVLI
jgi:hypothetical protein